MYTLINVKVIAIFVKPWQLLGVVLVFSHLPVVHSKGDNTYSFGLAVTLRIHNWAWCPGFKYNAGIVTWLQPVMNAKCID